MTRDAELTTIFLHQVKIGQLFYRAPLERRAWIRLCPAGGAEPSANVPVQRGGLNTSMNSMSHVWVRADLQL